MADRDYVVMLYDSLGMKLDLLKQLQVKNKEQTAILRDNSSSPDELEQNITQKGYLIERIEKLDDGFNTMFERTKEILDANKELYAEEIRGMQALIRQIADITADIEALEHKNEGFARERFAFVRGQIKEANASNRALKAYKDNVMIPGADENAIVNQRQ